MTTSSGVTGASRRDPWAFAEGDSTPDGPAGPVPVGDILSGAAPRAGNGVRGTAPIWGSVLFDRETGDADTVDVGDVEQGAFGDCYLMAPLAGLASTPAGRDLIRNAITDNKNAAGETVSYTVTLHEPRSHLWGLGPTTFEPIRINVDAAYVDGHAKPRADGPIQEVWPLVIEKAYAALLGGYGPLSNGGSTARALETLTGQPARAYAMETSPSYSAGQLQSDLAAGRVVILGTLGKLPDAPAVTHASYGLFPRHVYLVTGTLQKDGKLFVQLRNPWNCQHPDPVPFDEVWRWFLDVFVGSAPADLSSLRARVTELVDEFE